MIINNKTKAVIVLKAAEMPVLRLFPGHNTVEEKGLNKYFDNNAAAQGQREMNLSVVDSSGLTQEMKEQADKAKEKNDALNKAQRIIKKNKQDLAANQQTIDDQSAIIEQQAQILKDQGQAIQDLKDEIDRMKAAQADPAKDGS
jgi:hypothetical protein